MRLSGVVLLMLIYSLSGFGQTEEQDESLFRSESTFYHQKKTQILNLGVGFINPESFAFSILGGSGGGEPTPAINLSYEYALSDQIGIGALFNYYRVDAQQNISVTDILNDPQCALECSTGISLGGNCDCSSGKVEERVNVFTMAGKFSFHFVRFEKLDTYANTVLGYSINRRKTIVESAIGDLLNQSDLNVNIPTFVYYASIGARYYVSPQLGIYGEFGYGNTHILQLGMSYRIL